jgi:CubicO group peptidase (beta-lactamase class C family)
VETRIDEILAEWDSEDTPGASVAVARNGEVIYTRGVGAANLEYGVAITPSTVFDIASVSKQFGAYAIAILEDEGLLALDDDYRDYLPDMPDFGPVITLRNLLHHTSGVRDWVGSLVMSGVRMDDTILFEDIMRFARRQRDLNFAPGDQHVYSNTGYNLLAETVARVSGMSFREFTHERIFAPLGMVNTHFHDDHNELIPGRALSYDPVGDGAFANAANNLTALASSSLHSTADDLARWVANLDTHAVGPAGPLARMNEPGAPMPNPDTTYSFGQVTDRYRDRPILHHSGAWRGFRSHLVRFPEERFAVVVLSNLGTFLTGKVAREVADVYLADRLGPAPPAREPAAQPETSESAAPDPAALREYLGRYYSDELDTTYTIAADDEGLHANHARYSPIRLAHREGDTFGGDQWFFGEVRFTRDPGEVDGEVRGEVDAFLLSIPRVTNMRFRRRD